MEVELTGKGIPAFDPETQGKAAVRWPQPCGTKGDPNRGREHCQGGWYAFLGGRLKGAYGDEPFMLLDVGAGTGLGLRDLRGASGGNAWAVGIENDPAAIAAQDANAACQRTIRSTIEEVPSRAFQVVTAFDVIEHVVKDRDFLYHMKRIARSAVYVTTPNFTRSQARNLHHCREYTIPEFLRAFRPYKLWGGSPWGEVQDLIAERWSSPADNGDRRHRVSLKVAGGTRSQMAYDDVPDDVRFRTPSDGDDAEWPHYMAAWYFSDRG